MAKERLQYLEHFLDCVDFVSAGKKGSVSEDKMLVSWYDSSFYPILQKHLKNSDVRVRTEIVMLLTALRERAAMSDIKELRKNDNERVSTACLAYLTTMDENDSYIPDLIDELRHKRGTDFIKAAAKMRSIGRKEDIPVLREIYGQTQGEMRNAVMEALESIIDRNPDLKAKKHLLLSVPVFPDEKAFMKFIDNSSVYLDIRYRDNICPKEEISGETYNNVAIAFRKIQVRLYNEKPNLRWYSPEAKAGFDEVSDLLLWAADDIKEKKVLAVESRIKIHECKSCGNRMALSHDRWVCPECGYKD